MRKPVSKMDPARRASRTHDISTWAAQVSLAQEGVEEGQRSSSSLEAEEGQRDSQEVPVLAMDR